MVAAMYDIIPLAICQSRQNTNLSVNNGVLHQSCPVETVVSGQLQSLNLACQSMLKDYQNITSTLRPRAHTFGSFTRRPTYTKPVVSASKVTTAVITTSKSKPNTKLTPTIIVTAPKDTPAVTTIPTAEVTTTREESSDVTLTAKYSQDGIASPKSAPVAKKESSEERVIYKEKPPQAVLDQCMKMHSEILTGQKAEKRRNSMANCKWFFSGFKYTELRHFILPAFACFLVSQLSPEEQEQPEVSTFVTALYLGSYAIHFGFQIWMTFISGVLLFLTQPRHAFGAAQSVLFPNYFLCSFILSAITLIAYLQHVNITQWNSEATLQVVALLVCFILELVIWVYMIPEMKKLISVKVDIEKMVGIGQEIGYYNYGGLRQCPYFMKFQRNFRKLHIKIALGNILCISCSCLHLWYLASHICLEINVK